MIGKRILSLVFSEDLAIVRGYYKYTIALLVHLVDGQTEVVQQSIQVHVRPQRCVNG